MRIHPQKDGVVCIPGREEPLNMEELKEKLQYELDIINQMGYVDYFLIVWE